MKFLNAGMTAAVLMIVSSAALGQAAYPSKPIRFIVPFPPGGGTDLVSRALTQSLAKANHWTFVVDNKPGAGGNIGAEAAAKAAPDGYTLVMGQTSNLAINPFLYAKPPFNPLRDFAPVALVNSVPLVIVTSGRSGFRNMADVIAAAKAAPDRITYASPGSGTVGHLAGEVIEQIAGIKLVHIPYKGASPALTDLIGGQVDLYLSTPQAAAGHIKSGAIRALAVTSPKRTTALPEVPTLSEAGFKGAESNSWYGVLAPANTPPAIVNQLNAAIVKALKEPDLREALSREGGEVLGGTPAQFTELLKSEQAKWAKVVRDSGAKVD